VQGVSFIAALSTAPSSPRWCASAETYVTAAVLRTPTNETCLLDEENCCIFYISILFKV